MVYAYTNSKTIHIVNKIVVCSNDIQSKIPGTVTTDVLAINYEYISYRCNSFTLRHTYGIILSLSFELLTITRTPSFL